MSIKLEESWLNILRDEFSKDYMLKLKDFLIQEKASGHIVYPKSSNIFKAFELTPVNKAKVVILGQDPYHQPNQAHGLCFSVNKSIAIPPSLKNIYKELESDINFIPPEHGFLENWAKEGVLMLNTILTVRHNKPASHANKGWEIFTNEAIKKLSALSDKLVFLLWGNYANQKIPLIDCTKHHILTSAHPSPFSAHKGFLGCKHFSKANTLLFKHNVEPINWQSISY
ncbi:MAG: uracil-DNA glycosylase [Solitalea-like symbiont of Tyrophagus putrescentiae]